MFAAQGGFRAWGLFPAAVVLMGFAASAAEFRIDDLPRPNGPAEVRFTKEPGFFYILWRGDQPADIHLATDLSLGTTPPHSLADTNSTNSAQFYRVEKLPLTSLRDTDGDGLNDAWELLHRHPGAALNGADADEDHDGNGVADRMDALRESLRAGGVRGRPVLAAGTYHSLAIKTDGTLWGWGDNYYGELGVSGITETSMPVQIGAYSNWLAVSASGTTSYGLKADGTLWTWGQSATGALFAPSQIGNNSDWIGLPNGSPYSYPTEFPPTYQTPTALRSDGTLWQLVGRSTNAQPYGSGSDWAAVSDDPTDAHWTIKSDGTIWKGLSLFDTNLAWASISLGVSHALALQTNGTLWAWASGFLNPDGEGQLGNSGTTVPSQVGTDSWAAVTAGAYHSAGIKADGSLWWWGANNGFDPDDTFLPRTNRPTQFGTNTDWIAIAAGATHTVALRANGTIGTFGFNELGKLGNGTTALLSEPTQVGINQDWKAVATGAYCSFGLKTNGTLWAWGRNQFGVQGVGSLDHSYLPRQMQGSNWIAVSGGSRHTVGLQSDGSLWVWGRHAYSNFNYLFTNAPIRLGADADWARISAGMNHSLALKTDGSLWSWGNNLEGQLGTGVQYTFQNNPVRIGTSFSWADFSAGFNSSLGIRSSSLFVWGVPVGRSFGGYLSPQQIWFAADWRSVASVKMNTLKSHALALKQNGTLWSWGWNVKGQLGNGTLGDTIDPGPVGLSTNWSQIAAGDMFSAALQQEGSLWMAGDNFYGTLGFGSRADTNVFTRVGTGTNWTSLAIGYRHTLGLKADGTIWAWGDNSYGQCAQPALFEPMPVAGTNWGQPR